MQKSSKEQAQYLFSFFLSFFFLKYFIYLAALDLSCGIWDLVPQPEIEPRPPALGAQSLGHWTTRDVSMPSILIVSAYSSF